MLQLRKSSSPFFSLFLLLYQSFCSVFSILPFYLSPIYDAFWRIKQAHVRWYGYVHIYSHTVVCNKEISHKPQLSYSHYNAASQCTWPLLVLAMQLISSSLVWQRSVPSQRMSEKTLFHTSFFGFFIKINW